MPRYRVDARVTAMVEIIIEADTAEQAARRFREQIIVNAGLADDETAIVANDTITGIGAISAKPA